MRGSVFLDKAHVLVAVHVEVGIILFVEICHTVTAQITSLFIWKVVAWLGGFDDDFDY